MSFKLFSVLGLVGIMSVAGCQGESELEWQDVYLTNLPTADMVSEVVRESEQIIMSRKRPVLVVNIRAVEVSEVVEVGVRVSVDSGIWRNVPGELLQNQGPGHSKVWQVWMDYPGWSTMEYAVYLKDLVNYRTYWDNNNFANYHAEAAPAVRMQHHTLVGSVFAILMEVQNREYEKNCGARITGDDWMSETTVEAYYVEDSKREGYEMWEIRLDASMSEWVQLGRAAGIEYALFCGFGGGGELFWDNNDGQNYRYDRVAPPPVLWQSSFERAREMAMALDGSVFVLSSAPGDPNQRRWVSGYAPDGFWTFAREFTGNVFHLSWVKDPGILLIGESRDDTTHWTALTDYGDLLWELSADLTRVVDYEEATFLVGLDGGAIMRRNLPDVIGPGTGCQGMPMVNREGRMLCQSNARVVEYDLHGREELRNLDDGIPWAISPWGFVAVLSSDRTTLSAFDPDGQLLWSRDGLQVAEDTYSGVGRECPNHAHEMFMLYLNQDSGSPEEGENYLAGIHLANGMEIFRTEESHHCYGPCPDRDGRFYYAETYQRYGGWLYRVEFYGRRQTIDLGLNGRLLTVLPDGRILRRVWPYEPASKARIVLTHYDQTELFNRTFEIEDDPSEPVLAATNGEQLIVYAQGELTSYGL